MTVRFSTHGAVATIMIDRPEKYNALTIEMREQLFTYFTRCAADDSVRVVVLRGGERAFCSGADVTGMSEPSIPDGRRRLHLAHQVIKSIVHLEKPVIAEVSGLAVGIGWSLALACDYILATPESRFGQVFRNVGLAPDGGSVYLLAQYVGVLRAKELTMSARIIKGDEAYGMGLVTELVQPEKIEARARELAVSLSDAASLALGMTKRLFVAAGGSDLDRFLEVESHVQNQLIQTRDHAEGVRAFMDKRDPRFQGR